MIAQKSYLPDRYGGSKFLVKAILSLARHNLTPSLWNGAAIPSPAGAPKSSRGRLPVIPRMNSIAGISAEKLTVSGMPTGVYRRLLTPCSDTE